MTKIAHWNAVCGRERERERQRKRKRQQEGKSSVHLWQEAALEFSQLCVKTHQAIFVAPMIYVRPFVARTNLCHNGINKCATCAAIGLLQIPLCGHLRRHVQRIYLALECFAKPVKNTRILKMLFQIHRIIAQSVGRISWMTGIRWNWCGEFVLKIIYCWNNHTNIMHFYLVTLLKQWY